MSVYMKLNNASNRARYTHKNIYFSHNIFVLMNFQRYCYYSFVYYHRIYYQLLTLQLPIYILHTGMLRGENALYSCECTLTNFHTHIRILLLYFNMLVTESIFHLPVEMI